LGGVGFADLGGVGGVQKALPSSAGSDTIRPPGVGMPGGIFSFSSPGGGMGPACISPGCISPACMSGA
jgi:hypothetical protein